MEDVKYNMEDQVRREYIEPLRGIQSVELKEINVGYFLYLVVHRIGYILFVKYPTLVPP